MLLCHEEDQEVKLVFKKPLEDSAFPADMRAESKNSGGGKAYLQHKGPGEPCSSLGGGVIQSLVM